MTAEAPALLSIPTDRLIPTPDNPRQMREDDAFRELVASIKAVGVLQPLIARPFVSGTKYDLRAGHRRLAAAIAAGLTEVPVIVRAMDDRLAMEITVTENLQRENLHPLEEAEAIQHLLDVGWEVPAIADRLGKTPAWVARRAKLRDLSPAWRKAIANPDRAVSVWPATLLDRISRLPPATQDEILADVARQCIERRDGDSQVPTLVALEKWIGQAYLHALNSAPWKLDDMVLVPEAGACQACPKRSSCQPLLFEGLDDGAKKARGDRCLDPACFARKCAAHAQQRAAELREEHDGLLYVEGGVGSVRSSAELRKRWPGLLSGYQVGTAKKGDRGARPAMVVNGPGAGTLKWVRPAYGSFSDQGASEARPRKKSTTSQPTPLKARRAMLSARRQAHVIAALREMFTAEECANELSPDDESPIASGLLKPPTTAIEAMAIAFVFGTGERRAHRGEDWDDHKNREANAWEMLVTARRLDEKALCAELLRAVLPTLRDRLQIFKATDAPDAYGEARAICELLSIDIAKLEAAAAEAIPEPASWARLNADGTPKTVKAKPARKRKTPSGGDATKGDEATPAADGAVKPKSRRGAGAQPAARVGRRAARKGAKA